MPVDLLNPCYCPPESKMQLLFRLNQNLTTLFADMATDFEPVLINPNSCGCTELQVLQAINQNIVNFGLVFDGSGGSGSGIDLTITSLTDLAAVETASLTPPQAKMWIQASDGTLQVWELRAGTDATGSGVQRPDDYAGGTNEKVWYAVAT